jgi:hypothetical protein
MKFLLPLLLLFSLKGFSQTNTYTPFPEDSALWISEYITPQSPYNRNNYIMYGDTIMNGIQYNKLFSEVNIYKGPFIPPSNGIPTFIGGLRQDTPNKKVYFKSVNLPKDTLLYDFNLQVGDTLPPSYVTNYLPKPTIIASIKDTLINNKLHKKYSFKNSLPFTGFMVEGVGSGSTLFNFFDYFEGGDKLQCFKTSNISEFSQVPGYIYDPCSYYFNTTTGVKNQSKLSFSIYPTLTDGLLNIEPQPQKIIITNIIGEQVMVLPSTTLIDISSKPNGIYIIQAITGYGPMYAKIVLQH